MEIEQARLLTLQAAHAIDEVGVRSARSHIAMIKVQRLCSACVVECIAKLPQVAVPAVTLRVLDRAIQAHGAAGVSSSTFLAYAWATYVSQRLVHHPQLIVRRARTIRIADGPDAVRFLFCCQIFSLR